MIKAGMSICDPAFDCFIKALTKIIEKPDDFFEVKIL